MSKLASGIVLFLAILFIQATFAHKRNDEDEPVSEELYLEASETFYCENTWIELNDREKNNWGTAELQIRSNRSRAVIQFWDTRQTISQKFIDRIPGDVPTEILSATLIFKIHSVDGCWNDPNIAIHRIPQFNHKKANWDCSDYDHDGCCKQWRMIGLPPQVQPSYQIVPSGVAALHNMKKDFVPEGILSGKFLIFDVTGEYIEFFEKNDSPTIGWLVKKVCETGQGCGIGEAFIWARESKKSESPRLIVEFRKRIPDPEVVEPKEPCPDEEWNWDSDKEETSEKVSDKPYDTSNPSEGNGEPGQGGFFPINI